MMTIPWALIARRTSRSFCINVSVQEYYLKEKKKEYRLWKQIIIKREVLKQA